MTIQQVMCTQCGKPLSPYWRRCEHCKAPLELARPKPVWRVPTQDIEVRSYEGGSPREAGDEFARDAQRMATYGYAPVSQSWADRRATLGETVWLGPLAQPDLGSSGTLTVTYRRTTMAVMEPPETSLAAKLRQLDEAKHAGLLTQEEYERKRAAIVAAL